MDKQMIEEMAYIIYRYGQTYDDCVDGAEHTLAKWLINAGYRKIPEGAVVLTKEEHEELQKGVKTYNYTAMFKEQDAYRWEQGYLQGRKETAKEILQEGKYCLSKSLQDWIKERYDVEVK